MFWSGGKWSGREVRLPARYPLLSENQMVPGLVQRYLELCRELFLSGLISLPPASDTKDSPKVKSNDDVNWGRWGSSGPPLAFEFLQWQVQWPQQPRGGERRTAQWGCHLNSTLAEVVGSGVKVHISPARRSPILFLNALSGLHKYEGHWPTSVMARVKVRGNMDGLGHNHKTLRFALDSYSSQSILMDNFHNL